MALNLIKFAWSFGYVRSVKMRAKKLPKVYTIENNVVKIKLMHPQKTAQPRRQSTKLRNMIISMKTVKGIDQV